MARGSRAYKTLSLSYAYPISIILIVLKNSFLNDGVAQVIMMNTEMGEMMCLCYRFQSEKTHGSNQTKLVPNSEVSELDESILTIYKL